MATRPQDTRVHPHEIRDTARIPIKLLLLAALVLAGAGFALLSSSQPTSVEPHAAGPTPLAEAGDRTIDISEAELTTLLQKQLVGHTVASTPFGPATLQTLSTQLRSGQVRADGDALVGSTRVPVAMTARLEVENGRPVVVVDDLRAAGVSLPAAARSPLQQTIQQQLDGQLQPLHVNVKSVSIADGTLHVIGTRQ